MNQYTARLPGLGRAPIPGVTIARVRFAVLSLILLSSIAFGLGLGTPAITDSDEAFYAEASREMVERGDYLTPRFNYRERFQKPVFYYWLASAAYRLFGVSEGAARAGAALSGLGLVLLTFAAGRRWHDPALGLLAGAIVATSLGAVSVARMSLPDLPLAFFISLTIYAVLVALSDRPPHRARWWMGAGAAAGLGFLTKGPVALVVPALVVAVPFVLERAWRHLRPRDAALGLAAFALVGLPWYAAMAAEHGRSYLQGFFIGDNLERFATTAYNPHRSVFFYVPIVLGGMFPWSPFFLLGLRPAASAWRNRRRLRPATIRLLCWSLAPLLFFSISIGKQPRYILPMLPPLALALAAWIRQAAGRDPKVPPAQPALFRALTAACGVLLLLLAALLWRANPLLAGVPDDRLLAGLLALAAAACAVTALPFTSRWRMAPIAITIAGALLVVVLNQSVLAVRGLYPVEQMARAVLEERRAGEPIGPYRVFVRNLIFYTGLEQQDLFSEERLHDFLRRPDRVLAIVREDDLRGLREAGFTGLRPLHRISYFDPATAKLRTLISPDPGRDLQSVVLISNK